jgi:2-amino-4-hydroxy-6-hydroxymethyldihydropteridine diphosphokinase
MTDSYAPNRGPLEAGILFGANLGDPRESFRLAEEALARREGFRLVARSSLWVTEPVGGPPGQDVYLNRVGVYLTDPDPVSVVEALLEIELSLGRVRAERWGPRVIDLDLLYLGDLISCDERALVPHPRMRERAFVLYPLTEVRPGWRDPVTGDTAERLKSLRPPGSGDLVRRAPD